MIGGLYLLLWGKDKDQGGGIKTNPDDQSSSCLSSSSSSPPPDVEKNLKLQVVTPDLRQLPKM